MRAPPLLLALLLPACAPRVDGKTADEWTAELLDEGKAPAAEKALGAAGADAVGVLVRILEKGPTKARIQAAALLGRLGPSAAPAVHALAEALTSEEKGVRGMAAIALGRVGPGARDALVPLTKALEDRDLRVRIAASLAVYGILDDPGPPTRVLFRVFASRDPDVRAMVAEAFEEIGTPIVGLLVKSLRDEDETTRVNAAKTLAAMDPRDIEEARGPLIDARGDRSEEVRAAAAAALTGLDRK